MENTAIHFQYLNEYLAQKELKNKRPEFVLRPIDGKMFSVNYKNIVPDQRLFCGLLQHRNTSFNFLERMTFSNQPECYTIEQLRQNVDRHKTKIAAIDFLLNDLGYEIL